MQRHHGVCLFCRYGSSPRLPTKMSKRLGSSAARTKAREPYILPRLVIDLDATDSKVVRQYENMTDEEKANVERLYPVPGDSAKTVTDSVFPNGKSSELLDRKQNEDRKINEFAFNAYLVTPPDLIFYGLFGNPTEPLAENRISASYFLRALFKNAFIRLNESPDFQVKRLAENFSTDADDALRSAGFQWTNQDRLANHIANCTSFEQLHRTVIMISSTETGCKFLSRHGRVIVEAIRLCRKQKNEDKTYRRVKITKVLSLLNSLHRTMESKGVQIGPEICNAGIYYAARARVLPAVRMYLGISQKCVYQTNGHTAKALIPLQQEYLRYVNSFPSGNLTGKAILELITGQAYGHHSETGEISQPNFASLSRHSSATDLSQSLYLMYIMGLGEIGLKDLLWVEWRSQNNVNHKILADEDRQLRSQLFALAFSVAQDPRSALTVLQTIQSDLKESGLPTSEADELRLQDTIVNLIRNHYRIHNLSPSLSLLSSIKNNLHHLKSMDPKRLFITLNKYLVIGYSKASCMVGERRQQVLDWSILQGREGLTVTVEGLEIYSRFARDERTEQDEIVD